MTTKPTLGLAIAGTLAGRRALLAIARRFQATLRGGERVPRTGGALLVGNHTLFGVDSIAMAALVTLETGRVVRFLGDANLFRLPGLAALLRAVGAVPGSPARATELLREGELVAVYPGGVDDSFKLSTEAYRLQWGARAGFARVAIRAGAPIVPLAATGIDELFVVRRKETHLGRALLGSPRYDLPLPTSLFPARVPLTYHALAPVDTRGDADDPRDVARVRDDVFDALESVLAPYRASRGLS